MNYFYTIQLYDEYNNTTDISNINYLDNKQSDIYNNFIDKLNQYYKHNNEIHSLKKKIYIYGFYIELFYYDGYWHFYISVPRRHSLYGYHYSKTGLDCTYSNFSQKDKNWWVFGWDYKKYFNINNYFNQYNLNKDILTKTIICNDIKNNVYNLLKIHFEKTGNLYTEFPGSSWKNKRHRKIKKQKLILAEITYSI